MRLRASLLVVCALAMVSCATPSLEDQRELSGMDPRAAALRASGPPRRVVLVTVSGLVSSDYLDSWGRVAASGEPVRMPNLARLAREGAHAVAALPPTPGATRTTHATLVTGRSPVSHGIIADSTLDEDGLRSLPFLDNRLLRGTTLWDAALGRGVLALDWPTTAGARIELVVPEVTWGGRYLDAVRPRSSPPLVRDLEAIAELDLAGSGSGSDSRTREDRASRPPESWPAPAEKDAAFAEVACRVIASERDPALWLLRFDQAAIAQRARGVGSVEVGEALRRSDAAIGRLIDCFEAAGQLDETAIFVVGDVAYQSTHSAVAPNVALVRAGLIGRDPRASTGVRSWLALARSHGRSAYVYARDAANALDARQILEKEAERTGAFRVVSASQLAEAGADPQAWFGLVAAPGFEIVGELTGKSLRPSSSRSAAGILRRGDGSTESAVGFVAWGRGVRNQIRLPRFDLIDVAPTIAALLGLRLDDDVEGERHLGILVSEVEPPPPGPKRLGGERDGNGRVDEVIRDMRSGRVLGRDRGARTESGR